MRVVPARTVDAPGAGAHGVGSTAGRRALVVGADSAVGGALVEELETSGSTVATVAAADVARALVVGGPPEQEDPVGVLDLPGVDLVVVVVGPLPRGSLATVPVDGGASQVLGGTAAALLVVRWSLEDLVAAATAGEAADVVLVTPVVGSGHPSSGVVEATIAAGAAGLVRALRAEVAEHGVRVHHVQHGSVVEGPGAEGPDAPPGESLLVEDVVQAVTFVLSGASTTNLAGVKLVPTRSG